MAKAKKSKASATASKKKAGAKTTGEDIIDLESPPPKKKKKGAAEKAAEYFSTTTLKGFTVNPYSRGSKNRFDVVFHDSGVPSKAEEPVITLDHGGKALRVEWKLPEKLFTDLQATAQGINDDSARFNGYGHTQDRMQRAGVHPVERFYRSVPQVLTLNQECTGNPIIKRWDVPTDAFVQCEGGMHRQFNSMYVVTLKVAKDRKTLTSGPKFAGMANFGDVRLSKCKNGGGGGGGIG